MNLMVLFIIFSDNEAITDDPVKTVTNEAFHVSEKPHAHAHIFIAGGVKTYLQNKAVFWHLNSHVVNRNFHVTVCSQDFQQNSLFVLLY